MTVPLAYAGASGTCNHCGAPVAVPGGVATPALEPTFPPVTLAAQPAAAVADSAVPAADVSGLEPSAGSAEANFAATPDHRGVGAGSRKRVLWPAYLIGGVLLAVGTTLALIPALRDAMPGGNESASNRSRQQVAETNQPATVAPTDHHSGGNWVGNGADGIETPPPGTGTSGAANTAEPPGGQTAAKAQEDRKRREEENRLATIRASLKGRAWLAKQAGNRQALGGLEILVLKSRGNNEQAVAMLRSRLDEEREEVADCQKAYQEAQDQGRGEIEAVQRGVDEATSQEQKRQCEDRKLADARESQANRLLRAKQAVDEAQGKAQATQKAIDAGSDSGAAGTDIAEIYKLCPRHHSRQDGGLGERLRGGARRAGPGRFGWQLRDRARPAGLTICMRRGSRRTRSSSGSRRSISKRPAN